MMIDRLIRLINTWIYNTGDWMRWKLKAIKEEPGFWKEELELFASMISPDSDILEIGPGVGIEAITLLDLLDNPKYRALEPSRIHAQETERRLNEAGYLHTIYPNGVEELNDIGHLKYKKFEVILALASLLHLRKAALPRALRDLRRKLEKDGVAMVVMIKGDGEGFSKRRRLWFSYYQPEELREMFEQAKFGVEHFEERIELSKTYLVYYLKAQ